MPTAKQNRHRADLRIIATTDLHARVFSHDYIRDRPSDAPALDALAGLITGIRAAHRNTLLLDNGDFLQGNPLADDAAKMQRVSPHTRHPVIEAMNAIGYDAGTLGNHEFDYGLDVLFSALSQADYSVVSAIHHGSMQCEKDPPVVATEHGAAPSNRNQRRLH